jgi:hypothetical protein
MRAMAVAPSALPAARIAVLLVELAQLVSAGRQVVVDAAQDRGSRAMRGAMDREAMARAIKRAEQHVIDGDELIARQRVLIANLLALGLDATAYQNMLVRLEQTQSLRVQRVFRLKRDSDNANAGLEASAAPPT